MKIFPLFLLLLAGSLLHAQKKNAQNLVYVDGKGVLRYTKNNEEAAFFGTNYTVPFAYGYRSHKALGIDPEKAIDADVYHMARLGLDAFRVHVWDAEISDSLGNLVENEHLRLFDYLIQKLKERNIKILITPIAFWGNGYPEPDEKLHGFSAVYGKGPSVVKEEAIKAQEAYLKQFFKHINPYTKLSYTADPDVIATEINNEPHHSGPKERTTEYVNRLAAAIKSVGWTKPVFYNISESPTYADAVAKAAVDGHSFQWYPTALVAGHEQEGNFLPNVDRYFIPFIDTIPAFKNRARMVYEFDAGDVMQPIMYPAMARSFRTAGFQWATQFAYDPIYTAYANTEYQTHYLNLAYTPSKAISLLIASKAFHLSPREKSYGTYPADSVFDVFRVSYKEQLSEMNSEEEFYYSNNTSTQPKNVAKLKHLAGVGSSPVVKYEGTGAYFLDKIEDGVWKLEVMPDAITVDDPFKKASPKKDVVRIYRQENKMSLALPALPAVYEIRGVDSGNSYRQTIEGNEFLIKPGVYLIAKPATELNDGEKWDGAFYAPLHMAKELSAVHQPISEISAAKPYSISAVIAGLDTAGNIFLELHNSSNTWKTIPMQKTSSYHYSAALPVDMVTPGVINYRFIVRKSNGETYTFPGGYKGDPYAWDYYRNETYQTFVAAPETPLEIFNPNNDREKLMPYNPDWRSNTVEYVAGAKAEQLVLKINMGRPASQTAGWQFYFKDKVAGRKSELSSFKKLVLRARASSQTDVKLSLITEDAFAYSATVPLTKEWQDIEIPLSTLQRDSSLLLPRPYPGFQPLYFQAAGTKALNLPDAEKLEMRFGNKPEAFSVEVESILVQR